MSRRSPCRGWPGGTSCGWPTCARRLRVPPDASVHAVDLLQASDAQLDALFAGVEVVLHSAYIASGQPEVYSVEPPQIDRFEPEFANIRVAQRVYRAALLAGVRRVVMVSSNHAADWYEHAQVHRRERDKVYPTDLPLADNFYGWSKAAYELLGHPYACGTFGRAARGGDAAHRLALSDRRRRATKPAPAGCSRRCRDRRALPPSSAPSAPG